MARVCELTGRKKSVGNNVSHSNRKTKRNYFINLQCMKLRSDVLGRTFSFMVHARLKRTLDNVGGIDNFLVSRRAASLSLEGQKLRRKIKKELAKRESVATSA